MSQYGSYVGEGLPGHMREIVENSFLQFMSLQNKEAPQQGLRVNVEVDTLPPVQMRDGAHFPPHAAQGSTHRLLKHVRYSQHLHDTCSAQTRLLSQKKHIRLLRRVGTTNTI